MIDVLSTSCGRLDLLDQTLEALLSVNTHPIGKIVVHEDGADGKEVELGRLSDKYHRVLWSHTPEREGQIVALDYAMKHIENEYFLSVENDFICLRDGFVEPAIELMESDPRIHCVWLRGIDKKAVNCHPMKLRPDGNYEMSRDWFWRGFSFGASIKRRSHYAMIGSYGDHAKFDFNKPWQAEKTIDDLYFRKGFYSVSLPDTYFVHIGHQTTP